MQCNRLDLVSGYVTCTLTSLSLPLYIYIYVYTYVNILYSIRCWSSGLPVDQRRAHFACRRGFFPAQTGSVDSGCTIKFRCCPSTAHPKIKSCAVHMTEPQPTSQKGAFAL